jgi:hypothetical protein
MLTLQQQDRPHHKHIPTQHPMHHWSKSCKQTPRRPTGHAPEHAVLPRATPVVPSCPASTTREVCRPVAKLANTALRARKTAGGCCCSNSAETTASRPSRVWKVGSASRMACSDAFARSRSLCCDSQVCYIKLFDEMSRCYGLAVERAQDVHVDACQATK